MTTIAKSEAGYVAAGMSVQLYAVDNEMRTFAETVLADIGRTDPEKAERLQKRINDAQQAADQLRTGRDSASKSRKTEAEDKARRIRQEIQMLKTMGGDPKMIARRIAQLARELARAVREYASASSGGSSLLGKGATVHIGAAASGAAMGLSYDGGVAVVSIPPVVPSATATAVPATVAPQDGDSGSDTAVSVHRTLEENLHPYRESRRQNMANDVETMAAEIEQNTADASTDSQFAQEVRHLVALLKALAAQQEQRLRRTGDHTADPDFNQVDKALAEIEEVISRITVPGKSATTLFVTA